jgi:hypothetical protein
VAAIDDIAGETPIPAPQAKAEFRGAGGGVPADAIIKDVLEKVGAP